MSFLEKVKDEKTEGILMVLLAIPCTLLFSFYKNGLGGYYVLIPSLILLFLIFALVLWNRRKNPLLVACGIFVYIWLVWYWI